MSRLDADPRVRFAVPQHYTSGPEFDTFEEAVQHARSTIVEFTYPGQGPDGGDLVKHSRAFVDMRVKHAHVRGGTRDLPAVRWEVWLDRVECVAHHVDEVIEEGAKGVPA